MDAENRALLHLLFPEGIPDGWEYNLQFRDYISKLGTCKVETLIKEPSKLKEEKASIQEQTQELALANYKTFIQTADCSRQLFKQFKVIETKLDKLLEDLPIFVDKCQLFAENTNDISNLRRLNSVTLNRNAQLLEILELPQLMDSFIKDGLYEDALELAAYVRRLYTKHPEIPIFKNIVKDVEKSWLVMLHQLLGQLRIDLPLAKCLQIVGHLRRMEVFTESELRLKFLQARNSWLQTCLSSIPTDDATHHLNKSIEVTRVNLFNIITQYRAIFNDDEHSPLASIKSQAVNQNVIFFSWIHDKIADFLKTLESDLARGVTSIDSILGQCMYFGLSFSKVGCDFRSLMVPTFTKTIEDTFYSNILKATRSFEKNIERFTLINKNYPSIPWKTKNNDPVQPPDSLLEFYPLAEYLNQVLTAFNNLRLCPPVAIVNNVVKNLQESLLVVCKSILVLYGQEQQAFTTNSKDAFIRLCICFADDLVPYIQKCIHIVYPPNNIASHIGISTQLLQKDGITYLDRVVIVEPIKHLLPVKIEPVLLVDKEGYGSKLLERSIGGNGDMKEKEANDNKSLNNENVLLKSDDKLDKTNLNNDHKSSMNMDGNTKLNNDGDTNLNNDSKINLNNDKDKKADEEMSKMDKLNLCDNTNVTIEQAKGSDLSDINIGGHLDKTNFVNAKENITIDGASLLNSEINSEGGQQYINNQHEIVNESNVSSNVES